MKRYRADHKQFMEGDVGVFALRHGQPIYINKKLHLFSSGGFVEIDDLGSRVLEIFAELVPEIEAEEVRWELENLEGENNDNVQNQS